MSKLLMKGLLGAMMVSLSFGAHAAVIDCPNGYTNLVSNTSACQYSDQANQDFLNHDPMTVNAEAFFGYTDWSFIDKDDEVSSTSGIWSLNEPKWSAFDEIMMIFKSGRGTTLVGYNINFGATSGTWESPFSAPLFELKNTRDVSHISFYGRGATAVPEPSLLMLLLLGLGAVALGRLRSR
ncbi:PEP-CTERM sorting domain-containing protein [Marinimicrobium sp. ABcell2]|uniref:PEP-CTERM sorting domain-containing protein n=1 Tax=Marinimicrobium sp. ABcell2 TaxID=3069751 RepID=UPI0027AE7CCE|nr:PEP-CTERM sorting domain-containing protein [Marinimicrobium sp. ABcell2]MDQ2076946.1 PEP-CTERM sorting domain-containing protein [Marinimicrobium sp. ABcell2]